MAKFQQYADRTGWEDRSLTNQYYKGLKNTIKDKLTRMEKPSILEEMIEATVRIDNRL
jgi:hypothetical protein